MAKPVSDRWTCIAKNWTRGYTCSFSSVVSNKFALETSLVAMEIDSDNTMQYYNIKSTKYYYFFLYSILN